MTAGGARVVGLGETVVTQAREIGELRRALGALFDRLKDEQARAVAARKQGYDAGYNAGRRREREGLWAKRATK